MTTYREIRTAEDAESIRETVEQMAVDGWDQDNGRFDWDGFLTRLERYHDLDLGGDMLSPAIKRIQRIARAAAREAQGE